MPIPAVATIQPAIPSCARARKARHPLTLVSFVCGVAVVLFALVAPAAHSQSLTIDGPTGGSVGQLLTFQASATGCTPAPDGWIWFTDQGVIAGSSTTAIVQITWNEAGNRSLSVLNQTCGSQQGQLGVTIVDSGRVRLANDLISVGEGDGTVLVGVTRIGGSAGSITVGYATSSGTATENVDFTAAAGELTWPDGDSSSRVIEIEIIDDMTFEDDETFRVTLDGSAEVIGSVPESTIVITDDDTPPGDVVELTQLRFDASEDQPTAEISVRRSGLTSAGISVDFTTADFTATAGVDYTAVSTTIEWEPNDGEDKTVLIPLVDDDLEEGDEAVDLVLSNPSAGAILGNSFAELVIGDDDALAGSLQFTTAQISADETTVQTVLLVSRTNGSNGAVTVDVLVADSSARSPGDYQLLTTTLDWPSGDTTERAVVLDIVDDDEVEGDETIDLVLANPTGGAVLGSRSAARVVIVDDDEPEPMAEVRLGSGSEVANEGVGSVDVLIIRSGDTEIASSVTLETVAGTASAGTDYETTRQILQWQAGDASIRVVSIDIVDDDEPEGPESFVARLTDPVGTTLGQPGSVVIEIEDDDVPDAGLIGFVDTTSELDESAGMASIAIARSGGSTGAVSATIEVSGGSATQNDDYEVQSLSVSWADGESGVRNLEISIVDDVVEEPTETIELAIVSVTSGAALSGITHEISLLDNDTTATLGAEVEISAGGTAPTRPVIAIGPEEAIVVWQENLVESSGLFARRLEHDGSPIGNVIALEVADPDDETVPTSEDPDVAYLSDGTFAVVWRYTTLATAGIGSELRGRVYSRTGLPLIDPATLAVGTDAVAPRLAVGRDDTITVIGGSDRTLQTYSSTFTPLGEPTALGATTAFFEVSSDAFGWPTALYSDSVSLLTRGFDDLGQPQSEPATFGGPQLLEGDLSVLASGGLLATWTSASGVVSRRFDASGMSVGALSMHDESGRHPRLSANRADDAVLVWQSADEVRARLFSSANVSGASVAVAGDDAQRAVMPRVALTDDDIALVVYVREDSAGASTGIFLTPISARLGPSGCRATDLRQCLNAARFDVRAEWQDFDGNLGRGTSIQLTNDSGYFWFFSDDNVELVVKVLEACSFSNHYWVFATGLTNVEVHLRVTDTNSGVTRTYFNRGGEAFSPILDTSAFATCP